MRGQTERRRWAGFTLVEIAVLIVIMGVLAAFGVPRFITGVERSKAAEAFAYCEAVRAAQERYRAHLGNYATSVADLDFAFRAPRDFAVGAVGPGSTGSLEDSWSLTLTRIGSTAGYGAYTMVFNQDGFDGEASTLDIAADLGPAGGAAAGARR